MKLWVLSFRRTSSLLFRLFLLSPVGSFIYKLHVYIIMNILLLGFIFWYGYLHTWQMLIVLVLYRMSSCVAVVCNISTSSFPILLGVSLEYVCNNFVLVLMALILTVNPIHVIGDTGINVYVKKKRSEISNNHGLYTTGT